MAEAPARYRPQMTQAGLAPTHEVVAVDEFGETRELHIAGEFPLTVKVDGREIVTLMTLGTYPEALTLGYLRNQRMLENIEDVRTVSVDWEREQVNVETVQMKALYWANASRLSIGHLQSAASAGVMMIELCSLRSFSLELRDASRRAIADLCSQVAGATRSTAAGSFLKCAIRLPVGADRASSLLAPAPS